MKALSIVAPNGLKIASGQKVLEVRSWVPSVAAGEDLLIVENDIFLRADGQTDDNGRPVAVVKIKNVRPYVESDIPLACASRWAPGYFSWELSEVRPIPPTDLRILAARGIYEVDFAPTRKEVEK